MVRFTELGLSENSAFDVMYTRQVTNESGRKQNPARALTYWEVGSDK